MTIFHSMISQLPLSLSEKENGSKQWETFIQTIYKALKSKKIDPLTFFEEVTGYQNVMIQEEENEAIIRAMKDIEITKKDALQPVRVLIKKGGHIVIAHSFLNGELTKKTHGSLHKIDEDFHRIVDIHRLMADTLVLNEFEQFIQTNESLIRYLVTKHLAYNMTQQATPLPTDGKFSFDLIKSMKRFGFLRDETMKMKQVDAYKPIFYLEKNEDGLIQNIEHPFMQDIVVPEFLNQLLRVKEESKRKKAAHTTYSKSFQTKKGIRKATQEKMNQNVFLSHYDFVEIDNSVPLTQFEEWEKAFVLLTQQIKLPIALDHSLRIRRLGKQKATGVYYPSFKATVLDVDSPYSYAHELGHQIDHTCSKSGKNLSEELAFRPIMDAYKEITEKQMASLAEDDLFRCQWAGKGKYNHVYFCLPTEIFARCFELYLFSKGISSLLLKRDLTGVPYPKEPRFLEKIRLYFDALFQEEK